MWHGYGKVIDNQGQTNYEAKSLTDLVDQYNAAWVLSAFRMSPPASQSIAS